MIDQASKLRKIMQTRNNEDSLPTRETKAKVVSISSGKGGVGKTSFALNFSISLRRLGYEVVIIDADIGLGNLEILSGINNKYSISDIIFSDKDIFNIMGTGPEGINIISGGSGLKELALLDKENFSKLIDELDKLQSKYDFIIIDTGAGISSAVMDFIMASNEVIIICTPDPTSLMDSYTLIKALVLSGFTGKINIAANQVKNREEGKEIFTRLFNATNSFLRVNIEYLGYMERNDIVVRSIRDQIPFIVKNPNSSISKEVNIVAMNFLGKEGTTIESKRTSFAKKILDIFSKRGD